MRIESGYRVKPSTIIKTRESIERGATFINYTIATSLQACLVECSITESCDTAIYQESPVDYNNHLPFASKDRIHLSSLANKLDSSSVVSDSNQNKRIDRRDTDDEEDADDDDDQDNQTDQEDELEHESRKLANSGFFICYLFQCVKSDGFRCQFSTHNYYVSSVKKHLDFSSRPSMFPGSIDWDETDSANLEETRDLWNISPMQSNTVTTTTTTAASSPAAPDCALGDDGCNPDATDNQSSTFDSDSNKPDLTSNKIKSEQFLPRHLTSFKVIDADLEATESKSSHSRHSGMVGRGWSRVEQVLGKVERPHYSRIISSHLNHHTLHDSHKASIRIGQYQVG